jgi:hypothetical protein
MEGPTVYEVEPTLAVIKDDGSEVDNRALIRLDLKQSISAQIDLDRGLTSKELALAGFAPTGELVGYSKTKVWVYDPVNHALRIVFSAPAKEKIRYAAVVGGWIARDHF